MTLIQEKQNCKQLNPFCIRQEEKQKQAEIHLPDVHLHLQINFTLSIPSEPDSYPSNWNQKSSTTLII